MNSSSTADIVYIYKDGPEFPDPHLSGDEQIAQQKAYLEQFAKFEPEDKDKSSDGVCVDGDSDSGTETYDADVGSDDWDDSAFISTEPKPTETGPSPFMEQMLKEENGAEDWLAISYDLDVFFDHRYADLGAAEHVEISTSWQDDAFDPNDYDTEPASLTRFGFPRYWNRTMALLGAIPSEPSSQQSTLHLAKSKIETFDLANNQNVQGWIASSRMINRIRDAYVAHGPPPAKKSKKGLLVVTDDLDGLVRLFHYYLQHFEDRLRTVIAGPERPDLVDEIKRILSSSNEVTLASTNEIATGFYLFGEGPPRMRPSPLNPNAYWKQFGEYRSDPVESLDAYSVWMARLVAEQKATAIRQSRENNPDKVDDLLELAEAMPL